MKRFDNWQKNISEILISVIYGVVSFTSLYIVWRVIGALDWQDTAQFAASFAIVLFAFSLTVFILFGLAWLLVTFAVEPLSYLCTLGLIAVRKIVEYLINIFPVTIKPR